MGKWGARIKMTKKKDTTLDNLLKAEVSKICNQSKKSRTFLLVKEEQNEGRYAGTEYILSHGQVLVTETFKSLYPGGNGESVDTKVVPLNRFLARCSRRDLFEIYENLNDRRSYQK